MNIYDKTPLLIIEDDRNHFNAMYEYIQRNAKDRYIVEHFEEFTPEKLLNYKSIMQDNQIIIVDLHLSGKKYLPGEEDAGRKIIEDKLWPVDRSTYFIVFSRYTEELYLEKRDKVSPNWTILKKEFLNDNATLNKSCLEKLLLTVEKCKDYSPPNLILPRYYSQYYTDPINNLFYETQQVPLKNNITDVIIPSIKNSTKVLNKISDSTISFNRIGHKAHDIGIGVYGSVGRCEAMSKSDIEFSIYYYERDREGESKRLSVILWNRVMKYLKNENMDFEGKWIIERNEPELLLEKDVTHDFENKYMPLICIEKLLKMDLKKKPQVRNRHLQILTELKPVFNPRLINNLKKALIKHNTGHDLSDIELVLRSRYFEEMTNQFMMDTKTDHFLNYSDMKVVVFRLLNIMSLKIYHYCPVKSPTNQAVFWIRSSCLKAPHPKTLVKWVFSRKA